MGAMLFRAIPPVSALAFVALASCSKPAPPTFVPKEAKVVSADLVGLKMIVRLDAQNPNDASLTAQRVKGHVVLDGSVDLGDATIDTPLALPAKATTTLDVPLSLRWTDGLAVAKLAQKTGPVPYHVEGTVTVGGTNLNVDVPFKLDGTVPREALTQAALKSIPGLPLPGLPALR